MWWGTQKIHHQNISVQSRDTKNHQSKVELQERINNLEREREYSPFWMDKIWIEWNGENQIFIANEIGKRRIKIKRRWKDGGIVRLM